MTTQTQATKTDYEAVIGIEVHIQLKTRSKMFCSCDREYFDTAPNTHVCAVCLGMPGMLPVINRAGRAFTLMAGLAIHCDMPEHAKFDRKNYPYPDLMKGYQISQYDQPFCLGGALTSRSTACAATVQLTRIHLEEDTARLLHRDDGAEGYSLLDVNRSGSPLMELVTSRTCTRRGGGGVPAEAAPDHALPRHRGRGHGEGGLALRRQRLHPAARAARRSARKVEVKNMNSFRSVQRAIEFEIERQARILDEGGTIVQETRGYVDATGETVSQRSKEEAHDYRYFPEPDLPPILDEARDRGGDPRALPELPDARSAPASRPSTASPRTRRAP
jgi:aspartyl-tRNA(Asn)/glutamyl-tRNA(Gln) amidotransferase subunit B